MHLYTNPSRAGLQSIAMGSNLRGVLLTGDRRKKLPTLESTRSKVTALINIRQHTHYPAFPSSDYSPGILLFLTKVLPLGQDLIPACPEPLLRPECLKDIGQFEGLYR